MAVIRPTIPAARIIVRCSGESIRTDSFREANAFLLRRGASQTDKTVSFIVTWKDGRVAKDTVALYPGITLGNHLSAVWHRPADMTDDQYTAFIREKTSLKRSSGWPLSTMLRDVPYYDIGVGRDLIDGTIIAFNQQGDKPESTRERDLRALLFRLTTQALGTFDVDEAMQDIFGILSFDPDNRDEVVSEHEDEEGITSFEATLRCTNATTEIVFPLPPIGHISTPSVESLENDGVEVSVMDLPTKDGTAITSIILQPKVTPRYGHPRQTVLRLVTGQKVLVTGSAINDLPPVKNGK